jgi:hypothetical protein
MTKSRWWIGLLANGLWPLWLGMFLIWVAINIYAFSLPEAAHDPRGASEAAAILSFFASAIWVLVWLTWFLFIRKKPDPPRGRLHI